MERILLVEDSYTQAVRLQLVLEQQGLDVVWKANTDEALDYLQTQLPTLVLLDATLPSRRAAELCRRLKSGVRTRSIPVLMLTPDGDSQDGVTDHEADGYVAKSAAATELVEQIRSHLPHPASEPVNPYLRQARLLAIDDSPTYLERLRVDLAQSGCVFDTTGSGEDGLRMAEATRYDCVLVDLIMPDPNGIEVCHRLDELRQRDLNPMVILMLTSADTGEDMTRALAAGADDFISKSSDRTVLLSRLSTLLRRKFLEEENRHILEALRTRELEAVQARAETAAAQARAALVEELEKTATELLLAKEKADQYNRELERANRAKSDFLTTMSHELRTPLNAIIGFSDVLMRPDGLSWSDCSEYATYINDAGLHLLTLINDVLDMSRIESGRLRLNVEKVGVEHALRSAVSLIAPLAARRQQHVGMPQTSVGSIEADGARLRQILVNLLSNAVKYTPEQGHINITTWGDDDQVTMQVADDGIGIETADLERIFNPFEQVRQGQQEGTGLGLAITRRLVEAHGGTLSVASTPGHGSTFSVTLPRRHAPDKTT